MKTTGDLVRSLTFPFSQRTVLKHIGTMEGLENIPRTGSFVLVPNHSSYFDHFVVEFVVNAVRGVPTWFLTKKESFERTLPRIWSEAWYGIPVDRDSPSPETIRAIQRVFAAGDVLCVYPEGTRNGSSELLPFKAGAFRFAMRAGVPVIPMGIVGSSSVLAKGQVLFRQGSVHIAFGTPIMPSSMGSKNEQAQALADQAHDAIKKLMNQAEKNASMTHKDALSNKGAALVDELITASLDENANLPQRTRRQIEFLLELYLRTNPVDPDLQTQQARLRGLEATSSRFLRKILHANQMRHQATKVLRQIPEHKDANYLLGRWYLGTPQLLGGNKAASQHHFLVSANSSPAGDTRALAGLAEAQLAAGRVSAAKSTYRRVLSESAPEDPRTSGRIAKVRKELKKLSGFSDDHV
ncbi:lysophospholipid acyltransferase family protein [Arthrobacter psychrochitiniphilus]|uniref:Phospholipid/glycerol acyltransferase domain-containing protein n=1 Tax=Arthrobacter psychrochitiniphilus TaxID=291045 RepID=A0A2V3DLV6_9MICC|nr:lysophospholipid acyltransferase family protein [Arthrobacter psychrochitiniphilus]NYG16002.1 1-acyl-sn-glycerol-3-phosphate acyltransferase [Arthrobacter psychrochitiniphilus]PXA63905.1 hypothetical protein CVS29_17765 [Arthrobacter psychrochitiniphilus]